MADTSRSVIQRTVIARRSKIWRTVSCLQGLPASLHKYSKNEPNPELRGQVKPYEGGILVRAYVEAHYLLPGLVPRQLLAKPQCLESTQTPGARRTCCWLSYARGGPSNSQLIRQGTQEEQEVGWSRLIRVLFLVPAQYV